MSTSVPADLWSQQELAPTHAAGVLALRRLITTTQQPDSCRELCRCAGHHAGLGSQLHAAAVCLLQATLRGCAVVGPPAQFAEYSDRRSALLIFGAMPRGQGGWSGAGEIPLFGDATGAESRDDVGGFVLKPDAFAGHGGVLCGYPCTRRRPCQPS